MDGKNLNSHPANFASANFASLEAQPALSVALEELQAAQANQAANASLFAAAPTTTAPLAQPAPPGVSARELLEELRTGRLVAERAFLERTRTTLTESAPPALRAPALPVPALPAIVAAPAAPAALIAQAKVPQVLPAVAPTAALETAAPVAVIPAAAVEADQEKHLIFALGELRYAVPLDHIIEIAELEQHTPVPNVPDWILGITNLRGDILSLVDLNALFGESTGEVPRGSSLLVAQTNAGDLTTCLVVDRVYGVVNVTPDQVQKLDQVANHMMAHHTRGYVHHAGELLSLLDLEGLLRALELHAA
jgi:purine-binding chemotaxis protein CheW